MMLPTASDIAGYSDAELDQYLEANGRSAFFWKFMISEMLRFKHRNVRVEDPENLPDCFIQRLR